MEACLLAMRDIVVAEIDALQARLGRGAAAGAVRDRPICCPCADDAVRCLPLGGAALALRYRRAGIALRRLLRAGGQPDHHARPSLQCGHSLLHAGDRQCRAPVPPGRRAGLSAGAVRRAMPQAAGACRFRPAGTNTGGARGDARWRGVPGHRAHAGRAAGCVQRASAPHGDPHRLRHRFRRRDCLWQGGCGVGIGRDAGRSRLPCVRAARAAWRAPSRRSPVRLGSTKW